MQYDLGNNTFDQTNWLMKFMRDRDLGPDGPNWVAPFKGTLSLFLNLVDANGLAVEAIECGDVVTLDDTVSPEFTGDFEVLELALDHDEDEVGMTLQSYFWNAPTDLSDPPGDSYQTLPNSLLDVGDIMATNPFWLMQATPTGGVAADSTITLSLPDLSIWWLGQPLPTAYSGVQLTGIPVNTHVILYLNVTTIGATPTLTMDKVAQYPPVPLPAGQIVIFIGTLSNTTVGSPTPPGTPTRPGGGPIGIPSPTPGAPHVVTITTLTGYLGDSPVPDDTTPDSGVPEISTATSGGNS